MGTALDEARADLETARQQVVRAEALVERLSAPPRTGEDVARMMREAWPGPEWKADDACPITRARGRWAELFVSYEDDSNPPHWFVSCDAPSAGDYGENNGEIAADFPAAVSALRVAHARLLADLRALGPEATETPTVAVLRAERDAYKADFEAELAGNASLRAEFGARDDETMHGFVERLTRERDAERARANEELARAHDAERARDKAAGVAREALDWLSAAALPETDRPPGSLRGIGAALARLSASLSALASPAPATDPLAGLPEGVAHAVRDVADGTFGGVEVLGWYVEIVGPPTADFVLVWTDGDRFDRLLRVAPDGEITREVAP
jgi:hypothetical protein